MYSVNKFVLHEHAKNDDKPFEKLAMFLPCGPKGSCRRARLEIILTSNGIYQR
jgi:hypothetical protein